MSATLLDRTFELLKQSELARNEIAKGAEVGIEWLKKLEADQIPDPSVRRIQRLHDFLSSRSARKQA